MQICMVGFQMVPKGIGMKMRNFRFLFVFRCLLLMGLMTQWSWMVAQTDGQSPEISPGIALVHRVDQLKNALQDGGADAVEKAAQDIELLRRTYGTLDMTPLVEAIAIWARQLGEQGQVEEGLRAVNQVEQRWASRHPALLSTKVILLRKQGLKGYLLGLPQLIELTRIRVAHPGHRWLWIIQHSAWLRMMACMGLWLFSIAMLLRYRNVLRDLWEESLFKMNIGPAFSAFLGALILSFPVLLGLDPSVVAFFWIWLLAPFMHSHEVKAAYVVIILQFIHPALALMEPRAYQTPDSSILEIQMRPQIRTMEAMGGASLPENDRKFLSGWSQLRLQQWQEADVTFTHLLAGHPDRAEVLNNRGVARFELGRLKEADKDFEAAYQMNSQIPEIMHNQSVVAFRNLDSEQGIVKQEEARKVNPEHYESLRNASQSQVEQRTFALPLPETATRNAVLRANEHGGATRKIPIGIVLWVVLPALALVAFIMRLSRSMREAHPTQCIRCGEPFHTTDSPDVEVCSKCHHIFILKDGLHGENRKKKVDDVAFFQKKQRLIHRFLIVLVPGADRCFMGYSRQGFLELLFLCAVVGVALATGQGIRYPGEILSDPSPIWFPVALCVLAMIFLRSWLKLLSRHRHS